MAGGQPNPDFILNMPGWQRRDIPAGWPQFWLWIEGREHAVWGIKTTGSAGADGSTFAGIFDDNCQRNGILTVSLDRPALARTACRSA